jgi:hypothetical protein
MLLMHNYFVWTLRTWVEGSTDKLLFGGRSTANTLCHLDNRKTYKMAVHRVRGALDTGHGGVIAQFEWGKDVPRANIEAAIDAWLEEF